MLCLSFAMITMAIVRTSLAPLPNGVIDTSWLVFWQGMEAATAVIVVSLSAFRGLFSGEGSRASKRSKPQYRPSNSGGAAGSRQNQKQYEGLPERPSSTKAKPGTFFRYRGGSVMDEESQTATTYEAEEMELIKHEHEREHSPAQLGSRLEQPFSPASDCFEAPSHRGTDGKA